MNLKQIILIFLILSGFQGFGQDAEIFDRDDFEIETPELYVKDVKATGSLKCLAPEKLFVLDYRVNAIVNGKTQVLEFKDNRAKFTMEFDRKEPMSIKIGGFTHVERVNPMPLWMSIIPPLIVVALALIFKEVVSSLILGVLAGSMIASYYMEGSTGLLTGFLHVMDVYMVKAMADEGHISVIIFSTLIGGIVAVISKNGGMQAVVNRLARKASNPKSGQLASWFLGVAIFFDDYANTLVVGNTMRPLTDKLRISREKLSYIVDSTAAPIAAIALITTWIGAELGYIQGALETINSGNIKIEQSAYAIFLGSLQYAFYPILALIFMLFIILLNRDYGPMHPAEERARKFGITSQKTASVAEETDEFAPAEGAKLQMSNAIIPILIVVLGTVAGLVYTGYSSEVWSSEEFGFGRKLSITIGQSDSYKALLWSSMIALIVAVLLSSVKGILSFADAINASINGFKTMVSAVVILVLAWSLAALTDTMHTADFLARLAGDNVVVWTIPALTFIISAVVAFSTGSSWGTMAIIYPIMLPLGWSLATKAGMDSAYAMEILLNSTSCVLAGAVLGDHCSPISDTTILSSLATRCDHIEHVRTQMPYALTVGAVSIVFTTISAAFSISSIILFPAGILILYLIVRFFGKVVVTN